MAITDACRDHAVSLALRLSHHEWSPIRACLRDYLRLVIFLIVVSTIPEIAHGRPTYAAKIPNGASVPAPDGSGMCNGVGHKVCTGHGERNAFGEDFDSAGRQWTRELCMKDSDGDGFTNGEELGDPCCIWDSDGTWSPTQEASSHPGFESSFPDSLEQVDCAEASPMDFVTAPMYNDGEPQITMTMSMTHELSGVKTEYINYPFQFEVDGKQVEDPLYIVGFSVNINHKDNVHHFVGHFCPRDHDSFEKFSEFTGMRQKLNCKTQMYAWAPGQDRVAWPLDAAIPIGRDAGRTSIVIQTHYDNPMNVQGIVDTSELILHVTSAPRRHSIGIFELGGQLLNQQKIPANQSSYSFTSRCVIKTAGDQPLTVIGHAPHMHWKGIRLWSEKLATGGSKADGSWKFQTTVSPQDKRPLESVGRTDSYDADLQRMYSASYSFNPGDLISTTCVYSTSGMEEVAGGLGSENEMCIHFFYAYPEEAINKNRCHDSMLLHEPWPVELSSVTQDQQALSQLLDFETKPDVPSAAKWWDSVDLTSVVSTCDLFGMFEICDLDMGTLQDIDFCSSDLLSEECLEALRECETMFEVIEGFCGSEDDGIAPAEPVTMVNTLSETPDTDDQVIQITGTFLFPDLAVPDFDDAHKNSFKATIASAAGVSRDSVHIRAVRAASVEVDWAVAMPATGSAGDGVKAFEEAMATPNSDMFDPSTFGNVELVQIQTTEEKIAFLEFQSRRDEADDMSSANPSVQCRRCSMYGAVVSAAAVILPLIMQMV